MNDSNLQLESEYLGITEAAEYLRVSASTLRRWEKKGFLVPERTPTGIRRYTKQQLDSVMQSPQEQVHTNPIQNYAPVSIKTDQTENPAPPAYTQEEHANVQNEIDTLLTKPEEPALNTGQTYPAYPTYVEDTPQMDKTLHVEKIEDEEPAQIEHFGPHTTNFEQPSQASIMSKQEPQYQSNIEPLSQNDFESMFHLEHTMSVDEDDMTELEEYDNDAAVITPRQMSNSTQTHPVSYSSQNNDREEYDNQSKDKSEKRINPIVLLVGIFATVLVLGVAIWVLLSLGAGTGELLNPVVQ
jgi:DNA-binding transcriptional MerR regulator